MYYITTKSGVAPAALLATRDNRDQARAFAKLNGGTVRTQTEFEAMNIVDRTPSNVAIAKMLKAETTPLAHPGNIDAAHREIAQREAEGEDMTGATVDPHTSAIVKPAPVAGATWVDLAKEVAKAPKVANTIGKKEKFLKRVVTSPAVLAEAAQYFSALPSDENMSKVGRVRAMANWTSTTGVKLQRRDALVLFAAARPDIALATVDTQWQLVRSGKLAG